MLKNLIIRILKINKVKKIKEFLNVTAYNSIQLIYPCNDWNFLYCICCIQKTIESNGSKFGEGIKIENMLRLSQRKSLYIVNVQGERFLIASDPENTTFLAKLASKSNNTKRNRRTNFGL